MGHRLEGQWKQGRLAIVACAMAAAACGGSSDWGLKAPPGAPGDAVAVTTVTPAAVPSAGGAALSIEGRGFTARTRVRFGGADAKDVKVHDGSHLVVVVPPHAPGHVDVDVSDERGDAVLPGGVEYVDPPRVDFVDPGHLSTAGGTVIVHGGNFRSGARVLFGGDASASPAQRLGGDQLVVVAGPHAPGAVDVSVENPEGQRATLPAALVFDAPALPPPPPPPAAPSLAALAPASGPETGGTVVVLSGASFDPAASVRFGGAPATVTAATAAALTAVAPPHAPGAVDVVVANPDGQQSTLTAAYAYVALPPPPPSLVSVAPATGPAAGGTAVVLSGSDFQQGATVTFGGAPAAVVAATPAALTVLAPAQPAGAVDVVVTNPDAQSSALAGAFTFLAPPPPAPTVSGVTPQSGPTAGGAALVVAGADFQPGATVTVGGAPAAVTASSATSLTVTTPAHAAGVVALTVTNPDGRATTLGAAYTYVAPAAPALTAASPASGPDAGGTTVTLTGAGFAPGAKVTFGGAPATVGATAAGALTVTAPAHAAGAVDVVVTNPDGQIATLAAGYAYLPAPQLAAAAPATGGTGGGTRVTLAGSGFQAGAAVTFGGVPGTAAVVTSASIAVTAPAHAAGTVDVAVTNPDGRQAVLAGAFTFVAPAPVVSAVTPRSGSTAGGAAVVVAGSGFDAGATVQIGGAPATVSSRGATTLGAVAPAHAAGPADVTVVNGDGQSATLAGAFTYVAPAPTLAGVAPASGPSAGGNAVVVAGAGFQAGATVSLGGVPATVASATATSITVTAPPHAPGAADVSVANPDGQGATLAGAYTFVAPPPPAVAAAAPASGPDAGGTTVTLSGAGFAQGASVSFGGAAVLVLATTPTSLTVTAPAHAAGAVDVVVTNPDGQAGTLPAGFAYLPAPQLAAVSPASGPVAGGTRITLSGTGFQAGATVTVGGAAATAPAVSPASIAVTTPPHAAGPVDVVVTNPDGRRAVLAGAFTFASPPPAISAVTPRSGPTAGGAAVTVAGAGFDAGATVAFGGVPAAVTARTATSLAAVAPAHAAGAVDVTVVNGDGQSSVLASGYAYVAPPPSLAGVTPPSGPTAGGNTLLLSGAGFQLGATVSVGNVVASVVASSPTLLSVTAPSHAAGAAAVVVTNPDGQTATLAAPYTYVAPSPAVSVASPASGPDLGGTAVVLGGTGFATGATVTFGGTPAAVGLVTATSIAVTAPAHAAGAVDVVITNPDGQAATLAAGFAYLPPPQLAGVTPASGPTAGGTRVTVVGSGLQPGATVTFGGVAGIAATVGAGSVAVTAPPHAAGAVDVVVTNPDGRQASLAGAFGYVAPPPAAAAVTPRSGTTLGGTSVAVTGTGFDAGATVSVGGVAATVSSRSATSLTIVTPPHGAGAADVVVVNGDGQSSVLAGGYAYVAPPPSIAGVSPASGPVAGGNPVTVSGAALQPGATVTIGGLPAAVGASTPTSLSVTAPAHAAGAAAVVVTNPDGQAATLAGGYTFVAAPPPALASASPASGPDLGGTQVTLAGSGIAPGATVAFGGAPAAVVVATASSLTVTAPAHAAGVVDVVVTNPDGQAGALAAAFTYLPPPAIVAVAPASGTTAGGARVTVTGTGFQAGARVSFGGAAGTAAVVSATGITVTAPAHAAGAVDVTVTNPDGRQAAAPGAFTYVAPPPPPPAIAGAAPASGTTLGGTAVVVTGSGFDGAASVSFGGAPATVSARTPTSLTVVTPAHAAGAVDVAVVNGDGQAALLAAGYTFVAPPPPPPAVAGVSPASGTTLGGTIVVVSGSGFASGATVTLGGAPARIAASSATALSVVAPPHAAGPVTVTVTNPDGQAAAAAAAYTYVAPPPPPPALVALAPAAGPDAGGTAVTLSGQDFQQGATVAFGGIAAAVSAVSPTSIVATTGAHVAGAVDVVVTNPDGQSSTLAAAFTFVAPPPPPPVLPAPILAGLLPSSGPTAGGTVVALSGAAFQQGASVTLGGVAAVVTSVGASSIAIVAPPHAAGAVDVTVTNPDGQGVTLPAAFTFVAPPAVLAVTPATGLVAGGEGVAVSGAGFSSGATVTFGGVAATVSGTSAAALLVVAPPHAAGAVDVVVTNPDGQSATLAAAYTYLVPPPSVAAVSPASGTTLGGTSVTITGAAFQPGARVTFGGAPAAVAASAPGAITVTTPAHAAGAVDVTVTNPDGQATTLAAAFTYVAPPPPPPALAAVAPAQGPTSGGTVVTLSGAGFVQGASVRLGGAVAVAGALSATSISVTAPAHLAGPVDVTVTNPDGQASTLAAAFTYVAPPALSSVAPASGPSAGGTAVTLSGSGFLPGATVTMGGAPVAAVVGPASINVVAPPHAAGAVEVVVTNPDGQASALAAAFTYVAPPSLVSVAPATGLTTGGASLVVSGAGFQAGATVSLGGAAATVVAGSATSLSVTAPPHAAGAVDVTVVNPDGQRATLAGAFTYVLPPPAIATAAPSTGTTLGGTAVTVTGTGFQAGATASVGGVAATVGAVTATGLTLTTPPHAAGAASLTITNPDGQAATLAGAFTFVAPAPVLASVAPAQGPDAGGTSVTLAGSSFQPGAAVSFGGARATVLASGPGSITAVTTAHVAGTVEVTVTNPDGQATTLPAAFTFLAPPSLAAVAPSSGPVAGGTALVLSGAAFQPGATVTVGGVLAAVQGASATGIAVVAPPHAAGAVDVTVTNPDGRATTLPAAFTYVAPPSLVSVAPATGLTTGGAAVTLSGAAFQAGATVTLGGAAATIRTASATALSVTAPPHAAGAVDVTVVNPDGQRATLAGAFTYVLPPPAIATVAPSTGTTLGGTAVTVTGTGFQAGATVSVGGVAATVGVVTATGVALTTPPHAAGAASVTITNPDGQAATLAGGFTFVAPAPVLASVAPARGPDAGGTQITLVGSSFQQGATVRVGGSPAVVLTATATSITAVTPAHAAGPADVSVTNPDGQAATLAGAFTFVAPPVLASVLPSSGSTAGGTAVALSGVAFQPGAAVTLGGVAATVVSSSAAAIAIVTPAHAAGAVDVTVTNPDGRASTLPAAFTYVAPPPPPPTLTAIAPVSGPVAGGTAVTLAGSGFQQGATVTFGGAAAAVATSSATSLSVTAPPHAAGAVDVVVQNPDGQRATLTAAFAYVAPPPPPALASLAPASGPTAGGTAVVLSGAAFQGATVTFGGAAATVTAASATSLSVTAPAHAAGAVDVVVTNADGQAATLAGAFTYVAPPPPPVAASVTPATGPTAGGTAVVLAGTGFATGATVTFGGAAGVVSGVTATAISVTTPAGAAGAVDVVVANPDGRTSLLAGAFTYVAPPPPPVLAAITPATGTSAGGDVVVLDGGGFSSAATVTFGGVPGTVTAWTPASLSVSTPPGVAGAAVDVTVTNPDGQAATLAAAFTYVAPPPLGAPPLISTISPASGFSVGGTAVVITGSEFVNPIVWFGGLGGAAVVPQISSKTSLSVVTPPHAAGAVDVVVQNADGQVATRAAGFTYLVTPTFPPPVVTGVSPASGPETGNTVVTLTGTGFVTGSFVTIGGLPGIMGPVTANTITFTTPGGFAGPVDVTVTNPDRQSTTLAGAFTYVAPPPVVNAINVRGSPQAGGGQLLFVGTGLQNTVAATFGGAPATGLIYDPVRGALTVTVPPSPLGPTADVFVDLVLTNLDGQSTTWQNFHYGNPPVPTSFTPTTGRRGDPLTITGVDFTADATGLRAGLQVSFGGTFATIISKTATEIVVAIPKLNPGTYPIIVINFDSQFGIAPGVFTAPGP